MWAATTKNEHYIRVEGLKRVVSFPEHRQELVAGNMVEFVQASEPLSLQVSSTRILTHPSTVFQDATFHIGDHMDNFWEAVRQYNINTFNPASLLKDLFGHLPQLAFVLRASTKPTSIPVSVASLALIDENASNLSWMLYQFVEHTGSIADQLSTIRKLYEIRSIPNKVVDGRKPFPEDEEKVRREGVELEFRYVSSLSFWEVGRDEGTDDGVW